MKKVVEFDTAIGTSNLGDQIILDCLRSEMQFLFDRSFIVRYATHLKNLPASIFIRGSVKLDFADRADYKIIMGTNLLSRDLRRTNKQWPLAGTNAWLYENSILAGVGTTLSAGEPTAYTRKKYKQILRKDFVHSVRDEESRQFLESMGFQAVNAGCPTLWSLTPEFCSTIPTGKASRVIFSLSGYGGQKSVTHDRKLLQVLQEAYGQLYFWCQTTQDEMYLDSFPGTEEIRRIYSLEEYDRLLSEGDIDYIGTRLHGGIYALRHGVRSIIIAIDHRARGFHESNNLPICERKDVAQELRGMIEGDWKTEIRINQDAIESWKTQFLEDRPAPAGGRWQKKWWIRVLRGTHGAAKKGLSAAKKVCRRGKHILKKLYRLIRHRQLGQFFAAKSGREQPLDFQKVMFFTFQGDYTCNPKYISQEIIRRGLPWKQVWVTLADPETVRSHFPDGVRLVQFDTKAYYDELGTSGMLVDNAFNFPKGMIRKRKLQTYWETMHGSLGLKRIGPEDIRNEKRNERGRKCGALTNYALSNSTFETMVYESSFWPRQKIVETGHARNDIFYIDESAQRAIKRKVCQWFDLPEEAHLAMYAPTFRNRDEQSDYAQLDFSALHDALTARFGGRWVLLNRNHQATKTELPADLPEYVLHAENYPDIQELMIAIDVGITDYSSWICDYVLTNKPGFLYVPDLDTYDQARGFYYPLEETPFPICRTNSELADQIARYDADAYRQAVDTFLKARGCVDDGHASERIVDLMQEVSARNAEIYLTRTQQE